MGRVTVMRCTSWRTTGVQMKIIFTKEEIKEIILAHVHRESWEEFNTIEIQNWRTDEFAIVTYVEPTIQEPSNET
jgi:hypothetical protein